MAAETIMLFRTKIASIPPGGTKMVLFPILISNDISNCNVKLGKLQGFWSSGSLALGEVEVGFGR